MKLYALVLAAGQGKRMRSERIKLLHVVGGAPMVSHVARAAAVLKPDTLVAIIGNQAEAVTEALTGDPVLSRLVGQKLKFATQTRQLGTAHAVLQAESLVSTRDRSGHADVLILNGDVPLILPETLKALLQHHRRTEAAATVLTTELDDPTGYGRIVRDGSGLIESIVEERDATHAQASIREVNAGLYCADAAFLFEALKKTGRNNSQREYYLPDLFPILKLQGHRIETYRHPDAVEVLGVNDRTELAAASRTLYRRRAEQLMVSGVTIIDPFCTYIDAGVRVGRDTIIHPMARLEGATTIGQACTIGAMAHIVESRIGNDVTILDNCVITDSKIAAGARIGPFAHLRPGTVLDQEVHVGNFVEVKKSRLGRGTKANHLTYLGDSIIGKACNIGAGTITCNYDGEAKHQTKLADGVFIGSDTQLVAPVKVGKGAYIGAGSTISKDVPAETLAVTRAPLRLNSEWVKKKRAKGRKKPRAAGRRGGKR